MTGRAVAIVVALALSPAQLHAQDSLFVVNVASADVHKGPSIATPVIGHVASGTTMPVLRNLGSWVKVDWPAAPDGFAYLHVTTGRLTARGADTQISKAPAPTAPAAAAAATSAPVSASLPTGHAAPPPRPAHERVVIRREQDKKPISHVVGIGGLFGTMSSFGATTRGWRDDHWGVQVAFSRDEQTSSVGAGRVTSMQLEPAVVYALFDHVSDYFWVRPYVGSGLSVRHQTLQDASLVGAQPASTGAGFRAFGGAEVTFAGAPRLGVSADFGYRRFSTPFPGFEPSRFTAFVSAHWYVK